MQPEILKFKLGTSDKLFHFSKSGKPIMYHVGISGGKDSDAVLLWMVNESGIPHEQIKVTFTDTENEHDWTYKHVQMLNEKVFPVETVHPELGFYPLALKKQRFPSRRARFCTQKLKMEPTKEVIDSLIAQGYEVISVSGVRADESEDRKKLPEWSSPMDSYFCCWEWRPLLRWKIEDVWLIHNRYGVPRNLLYDAGMKRVGCFPCINSNKKEIYVISKKFPERIDSIREQEINFPTRRVGFSSFFHRKTVPPHFRSKEYVSKGGEVFNVCTIDDVVRWANTTRGGKTFLKSYKDQPQQHLIEDLEADPEMEESDDVGICPSQYGVCE